MKPICSATPSTPTAYLPSGGLSGPVAADYQTFVHALDTNGQALAQADRFSWPGRYWRAGDTLYLWYDLQLPDQTSLLRIGMYTLEGDTYHNVEVIDASGVYLAQWAEITLD